MPDERASSVLAKFDFHSRQNILLIFQWISHVSVYTIASSVKDINHVVYAESFILKTLWKQVLKINNMIF